MNRKYFVYLKIFYKRHRNQQYQSKLPEISFEKEKKIAAIFYLLREKLYTNTQLSLTKVNR